MLILDLDTFLFLYYTEDMGSMFVSSSITMELKSQLQSITVFKILQPQDYPMESSPNT